MILAISCLGLGTIRGCCDAMTNYSDPGISLGHTAAPKPCLSLNNSEHVLYAFERWKDVGHGIHRDPSKCR